VLTLLESMLTLLESVSTLKGICMGIVVGFGVDKVWRRREKKILIDRLRWNSSNI
jgi:hypothetical protein